MPVHAGLVNSGIRLNSLDLSHNQFKLVDAAALATIIGGAVLQHAQTHPPHNTDQPPGSLVTQDSKLANAHEAAAPQLQPDTAAASSSGHEADSAPSTSASATAAGSAATTQAAQSGVQHMPCSLLCNLTMKCDCFSM